MEEGPVFYCCNKCRGLFPINNLLKHNKAKCDGTVNNSNAKIFAVDAAVALTLDTLSAPALEEPETTADNAIDKIQLAPSNDIAAASPVIVADGNAIKLETPLTADLVVTLPVQPQTKMQTTYEKMKRGSKKKRSLTVTDAGIVYADKNPPVKKEPASKIVTNSDHLTSADYDDIPDHLDEHDEEEEYGEAPKEVKKITKRNCTKKEWRDHKAELEILYEKNVVDSATTTGDGANNNKNTSTKSYQCTTCDFKTDKVGFFDRHVTGVHGPRAIFICDVCAFQCDRRGRFNRHMNKHNKPYVCEVCGARFSSNVDLRRHTWIHTGEKPFQCQECDYKTRFRERMRVHRRVHSGERLACGIGDCKYVTMHETALKQHHDSQHNMGKRLYCPECDYNTLSSCSMVTHKRRHTGVKNFACSMCDYKALSRQAVQRHIRRHTGEKVYQCDQCSYSSAHRTAFNTHMLAHSGLKPYECSACGYNSVTKQKVTRHLNTKSRCHRGTVITHETPFKVKLSDYLIKDPNAEAERGQTPAIITSDVPEDLDSNAVQYIVKQEEESMVEDSMESTPALDGEEVHESYEIVQSYPWDEVNETISAVEKLERKMEDSDEQQQIILEMEDGSTRSVILHDYARKDSDQHKVVQSLLAATSKGVVHGTPETDLPLVTTTRQNYGTEELVYLQTDNVVAHEIVMEEDV